MKRLLGLVTMAVLVTGCGGGSAGTAAQPVTPAPSFSPISCPSPAKTVSTHWPSSVPKGIPKPVNATILGQLTTSDGIHILRFTTPTSLRESTIFVVETYPKAGFLLGRGDAEANEADAPFINGNLRGLTRLTGLAECQTLWLLATVHATSIAGTTPLLPPHATPSPSPLPFAP